ncbi:MAG: hypothetical protein WBR26_08285 [Candidatus Acidiferrum sp.]
MRALLISLAMLVLAAIPASAQEDEIVANLAGGRVIIHVANDGIVFGAIDHPLEAKSVPPRVATVGSSHIGIFFGASEWQIPAQPQPIRLDRTTTDVRSATRPEDTYRLPGSGEPDLELIGVGFLEQLRPLVSQLHHRIDLKPDEPLMEIVLIGYAPQGYGPEVWLIDYGAEQQSISATTDFWQTRILRPRFTQLYPPEKHQAKTLVETRFPNDLQGVPLLGLIQQNDPQIAQLRSADPRFAKVIEHIEKGQASKVLMQDAGDFLRAALPLLAGNAHFVEGEVAENGGFEWIVPPQEPKEKTQRAEDKNRPADAPTLMRKPNPDQ